MRRLAVALVLIAACSSPTSQPTISPQPSATLPAAPSSEATLAPTQSPMAAIAPITELRSSIARQSAGPNRLMGVDDLAAADAAFAFRLYHELAAAEPGNLFFSPYSISTALSMGLAGARGTTAEEIRAVLGVGDDESAWHEARNRLELALASSENRYSPVEGEATPLTLEPTNAIFGQADYAFRDAFLDLLATDYGAGTQAVDFISDPEAARRGINEWVAEKTRDRIEELLAEGSITPLTRAVLVNAIYFKANWYWQFNPEATTTEPFHLIDGSTPGVQMMHASPETRYANGRGWTAVTLPYWGNASMIIIVPDQGEFATVGEGLDSAFVDRVENAMSGYEVHLGLPRWVSGSTLSLVPALQDLGMVDAFDPAAADLSGMADFSLTGERLYVGDVVHQANITVDEEGTEAAAATAELVFGVCRCPPPEVTLTIDRPFIYLIRDDVTGEILFVGRQLEP